MNHQKPPGNRAAAALLAATLVLAMLLLARTGRQPAVQPLATELSISQGWEE